VKDSKQLAVHLRIVAPQLYAFQDRIWGLSFHSHSPVALLQLKASPFRAGMEGKAYKLCVDVVAAPKPERDAGQTTANMECPDRWGNL